MNIWRRVEQLERWNEHLLAENNFRRQEIELIMKHLKVCKQHIPAETKLIHTKIYDEPTA